jgi:small basic protein
MFLHQLGLGLALGIVLGGAFGLIREDMRRGYRRPADPLWFLIGLASGLLVGVGLHYLGLTWRFGLGLGLALGLVFGAVAGTIRADIRASSRRRNDLLH